MKSNYVLTSHNNSRLYPEKTLKNELRFFEDNGAGEIIVNSVDRDGTMAGYDFNLIKELYHHTKIPMTVIGGASSLENIREVVSEFGNIGVGAGSLFVYQGKYRAVLINYPEHDEKLSVTRC